MSENSVQVNICGTKYLINSNDSETYVKTIALDVDKKIEDLRKQNSRVSLCMASIFVALSYCDEFKKSQEIVEKLQSVAKRDEEDLLKLKTELEASQKSELQLRKEKSDLIKENTAIVPLKKEVKSHLQKISNMQSEQEESKKTIRTLRESKYRLEAANKEYEKSTADAKTELEYALKTISTLKSEIAKLNEDIKKKDRTILDYKSKLLDGYNPKSQDRAFSILSGLSQAQQNMVIDHVR